MKTLILYATKYGAAKRMAEEIAAAMGSAEAHDLREENLPSPEAFDQVILGGSLYAGMVRKEAKAYALEHAEELQTKPLGLFLSGMSPTGADGYFAANFPQTLLDHAKAKASLGGVFDPAKVGFLERLIMRIVSKRSGFMDTISAEGIARFAEDMKA